MNELTYGGKEEDEGGKRREQVVGWFFCLFFLGCSEVGVEGRRRCRPSRERAGVKQFDEECF